MLHLNLLLHYETGSPSPSSSLYYKSSMYMFCNTSNITFFRNHPFDQNAESDFKKKFEYYYVDDKRSTKEYINNFLLNIVPVGFGTFL